MTQVKDLPVSIFENFKNFRIEYEVLGRKIKMDAVKKGKYYRRDARKYQTYKESSKEPEDITSSGDDSIEDISIRRNVASPVTRPSFGKLASIEENEVESSESETSASEESDDDTIIVGSLDVNKIRVSYTLIPGNSVSHVPSQGLEHYFAANRKILFVLCGDIKEGRENIIRNTSPTSAQSSADKIFSLQKSLSEIKLNAINATFFDSKYSDANYLKQKHLTRLLRKSAAVSLNYKAQPKKTERGEILPEDAIAYGYIDYYQFLNATVNRIDIISPMAYAINNIPSSRSVPMLKVSTFNIMFGVERDATFN
jgi:hypothetical protein